MHIYRDSNLGPMVDFFITVIFAFLWLVCSSAWARGLHNVKYATGLEGIKSMLSLCNEVACYVTQYANMRGLNVSAVLGFLNCLLWSGNGWFVYKETSWHTDHQRTTAQQGPGRRPPPARV
ncbi:SYNPR protein, partial [Atractosteus spatula]|nr:SYNPR protein [Atractosteus spatula]